MTDLTKITTPFGLLDDETQDALKAHNGPIEMFLGDRWKEIPQPVFHDMNTYRAKPLTLPAWPHGLDPKWKWISMDKNGRIYVYEGKPIITDDFLWVSSGSYRNITGLFADLNFNGIHWRDAIIQRPEGV